MGTFAAHSIAGAFWHSRRRPFVLASGVKICDARKRLRGTFPQHLRDLQMRHARSAELRRWSVIGVALAVIGLHACGGPAEEESSPGTSPSTPPTQDADRIA